MTTIEKDWKLYQKLIPEWQERYMDSVNKRIESMLKESRNPSAIFWDINKLLDEEKKKPGVLIMDAKRSNLDLIMVSLVTSGAIHENDIVDFSDEMKEMLMSYFEEV